MMFITLLYAALFGATIAFELWWLSGFMFLYAFMNLFGDIEMAIRSIHIRLEGQYKNQLEDEE